MRAYYPNQIFQHITLEKYDRLVQKVLTVCDNVGVMDICKIVGVHFEM